MNKVQGVFRRHSHSVAFLFLSMALLTWQPSACGQLSTIPREDFWITDGEVNALVVTNGLVYLGGSFQNVGPQRAFGADVNGNTGVADFGSPKIDGPITAVTPDGSGGWLIARIVFGTDGIGRSRLMRVRADKSVDPTWDASTDRMVYALLTTADRVYVGGQFGIVGGSPRRNLAALDLATAQPLPWDPSLGGESDEVRALALSGQTLYVGGAFTSVGGVVRNSLAAVDVGTGAVTGWNPRPEPNVLPPPVRALAISGTNVFVGGHFTSIGGSFRTNLAAVSSISGFATSWNPNPDGEIDSIAVVSNTVFVTGTFANIGGMPRTSLAAIDATLGTATVWNPDPTPPLQTLGPNGYYVSRFAPVIVDGDRLLVGGSFTNIASQTRRGAASFDLATGGITGWNPYAIAGQVNSLAAQGDRAYLGGSFRSVNGVPRRGLAALVAASGAATVWNPDVAGTVRTLGLTGQTLYLGGSFTQVGSQLRTNLAAVDIATGQVASWSPGMGGTVNALAIAASRVYIGGEFASVAGQARTNLAAVGFDGTLNSWNPGAPGWVQSLLVAGNVIYVAGYFSQLAGQSRPSLGAVDLESGAATVFNPSFQAAARAWYINGLAIRNGALFIAGHGQPSGPNPWFPYLASWNTTNSTANWEMAPEATAYGRVPWGLGFLDDTLYAGSLGAFNAVTGVPQSWTYAISPADWGAVRAIAPLEDSLIVAGNFKSVSEPLLCNLAVFSPPRPVHLGAQLAGNGAVRVEMSGEPGVQIIVQRTTNFLDWTAITTNSGSFFYDDTNAAVTPARFYRALRQP